MMMTDLFGDTFQLVIAVGDLIPFFCVRFENYPFFIRQFARLIQYFQGDTDFSDVMQQTQQGKLALLDICKSYSFSQLAPIE